MKKGKKITIITDSHAYGAYPIWDKWSHAVLLTDNNTYSLGDNFDLANVKKSEAMEAVNAWSAFQNRVQGRSVSSNHEIVYGATLPDYLIIEGDVLLAHAHKILWSKEKCDKWENKKLGLGRWGRAARMTKNSITPWFGHGVSKKTLKKLAAFAKEKDCSQIIVGHLHSSFDGMVDGVRVVVCGRGVHDVII